MPRFHVGFYGGDRIVTVAADDSNAARAQVAKARSLNPLDLSVTRVEERTDTVCGKCGWKFKGRKYQFGPPGSERCTVCNQEAVVASRERDLQRARQKLAELRLKRAAQKAQRGQ